MARTCTILLFLLFVSTFLNVFSQYEQELWLVDNDDEINMVQNREAELRSCDFTMGKWIYDQSYPLYDSTCPYLSTAVACKKNGRPDSEYEKWRWKPNACTIPRFDALDFLGRMRRKRIMLVGDSIMRNQWESLVCLVQSVIPTAKKMVTYNGPTLAFHALDFETSIEFCWAPFLVELKKGSGKRRILHLDLIEENAKYWREADVLVFDSAHWWMHSDKFSSWDLVMEGQSVYESINPMTAYERGLMTWARWIELNLDPRTTRVFFRSMSPRHNRDNGFKCYNQREPFGHISLPRAPEPLLVLKRVLRRMRFPVYLQDITTLSDLRKDGHPSIYARAMQHVGQATSDCSHWCLPGVPDTWNEMLNALL